jgi:phosphoribosylformylglycinamidine synthase
MGYSEVADVRLGKLIEVTLEGDVPEAQERARLDEMCKKLLANTVIEDYRIEL